jgi:hypothetical protein
MFSGKLSMWRPQHDWTLHHPWKLHRLHWSSRNRTYLLHDLLFCLLPKIFVLFYLIFLCMKNSEMDTDIILDNLGLHFKAGMSLHETETMLLELEVRCYFHMYWDLYRYLTLCSQFIYYIFTAGRY